MDKDKSILEKFTDTVKDIANSASQALKAEEPARVDETSAAYMPLASEGLVSDPLLVPPVAARLPRRRRTVKKTANKASARKAPAGRAAPKTARKAAKSARGRSKASSRSAARKSAKRTTKRATRGRTANRPARRSRR